jgi:ring-1,2-phenylacetyl-CoA epoxidase subunit PaaD
VSPAAGHAETRDAALAQEREAHARDVWRVLANVPDPEIPVLSIVDLGIVRAVNVDATGLLEVQLTPTYSGCPATEVIRGLVRRALDEAGYASAKLREVISPPWTSDWISAAGREKLRTFGIAPPAQAVSSVRALRQTSPVACPRCASTSTTRISEFGSTPCKAHYRCDACREPFDYFKCI